MWCGEHLGGEEPEALQDLACEIREGFPKESGQELDLNECKESQERSLGRGPGEGRAGLKVQGREAAWLAEGT